MDLNRNTLRRMILNEVKSLLREDATVGNILYLCAQKLGQLETAAAQGKMPKFKELRDELISLKDENQKLGEILADFDKALCGALYFGLNGASDEALKRKFKMTKKESRDKIKDMIAKCKK